MKYTKEFLINHVNKAFEMADQNISKLPNDVLQMEGMTGKKTRHLYNNLCNIDDANYLEIGTWKGSSFVSATYGNKINSIAVDNWAEFTDLNFGSGVQHPKESFFYNMDKFCNGLKYSFKEKDSFKLVKEDLPFDKADIYLYDGNHDYNEHKMAVTYFTQFLSDFFIIMIDDWSWGWPSDDSYGSRVIQKATYDGIEESGIIVHHKVERMSDISSGGTESYWCGVCVLVCEIPKKQ
jgi:hypothetical protein